MASPRWSSILPTKTKSPLKARPLRLPGQSVDEELERVLEDKVRSRLFVILFSFVFALMEWWRWYFDVSPNPLLYSLFFIITAAVASPGLMRAIKSARRLKLGRDGERAVGQVLERLLANGYHIFHDVPGDGWNIDHVIVGPGGIFTVETKTLSKPEKGRAAIQYGGDTLLKGGVDLGSCLDQAKAQATSLRRLVGESLGRTYPIQPTIVFPGWFIEASSGAQNEVWVLEPKALLKWVRGSRKALDPEQVREVRRAISQYVRESA